MGEASPAAPGDLEQEFHLGPCAAGHGGLKGRKMLEGK